MLLVSLHLPKTAGTSFGSVLKTHFGNSLLRDYADVPINTPPFERNQAAMQAAVDNAEADWSGIECIHGHFLPVKYLLLAARRELKFVTWMRDPVERVLSHYYFWRRGYDPATAPPLHRKVVEEDWPLERFCLSDELKDLYRQFLWGFAADNFDFIGITEFFDEDFAYFSKAYLGTEVDAERLNVGDGKARSARS